MPRLAASLLLVLATAANASTNSTPPVPAGDYKVDKPHTSLLLRVNHMGFSTFTARFTGVDVALKFDPNRPTASSVKVNIDPNSIETDNAPGGFLDIIRGEQLLDTAKYPQLTFRSKSVEQAGANKLRVHGELTLHGVTRPVVLEARYNGGYAGQPMDPHARVGFSATATFKRSDFGMGFGVPAPGTTMGVGDEIDVVIESELSGPALAK
ncbi:MAG TPA: YceI family protein [Steroidobacteraceae bacterium]|jgi:polyisoprenoid-binding protein YceI|nr:YceI family protein [Steroidobacteraceae bacterium]